ncbi:hypothetical protein LX36DRAFT_19305 [Colletotrichum falcatum]|nr:hypothetical protein LX36DRAFT_19305 [Colletotrichum falcatum]
MKEPGWFVNGNTQGGCKTSGEASGVFLRLQRATVNTEDCAIAEAGLGPEVQKGNLEGTLPGGTGRQAAATGTGTAPATTVRVECCSRLRYLRGPGRGFPGSMPSRRADARMCCAFLEFYGDEAPAR